MIFLRVLKLKIIEIINPGHDHQISALYIVSIPKIFLWILIKDYLERTNKLFF